MTATKSRVGDKITVNGVELTITHDDQNFTTGSQAASSRGEGVEVDGHELSIPRLAVETRRFYRAEDGEGGVWVLDAATVEG